MILAGAAVAALGVICALQRIGAPDGFVRALGPALALLGLAALGLGARAANLNQFVSAGRRLTPIYAGLGFMATASGLASALDPNVFAPSLSIRLEGLWPGLAAGLVAAALAVGPLSRGFGATGLSDIFATRFQSSPFRALAALALAASAGLAAIAGYEATLRAMTGLMPMNRQWLEGVAAVVLILTTLPGGLADVLWCGAASGAGILLVSALGSAVGWFDGFPAIDPTLALELPIKAAESAPDLAADVGAAIAVASFFAFASIAGGCSDNRGALKAGFAGLGLNILLAILAVAATMSFPIAVRAGAGGPAAASLVSAGEALAAFALARAGVNSFATAYGLALRGPIQPFPTLASVRLARMRGAMLMIILACVFLSEHRALAPERAIVAALAVSLFITAPMLALASIRRVGPAAMTASVVAWLGALYLVLPNLLRDPSLDGLMRLGLLPAAAMVVTGAIACIALPLRARPENEAIASDPFGDFRD
jgi:hypothetical protein